uniref:3-hydroxybutyryl-CoA dehydrogenase n=1 Tax=Blastobotrys adeninivorans TaxID=409370 RepID=A0A060T7G6_BLAAD
MLRRGIQKSVGNMAKGVRFNSTASAPAASVANPVSSLAVVGAGQMGVGIAYVAAANAKVPVQLVDSNEKSLAKGTSFVDKMLAKNVSKGKITEQDAKDIKSRITGSLDLKSAVKDVDMVIEAVPEIPDLKASIFKTLEEATKSDAILGTNTSSISITRIASSCVNPAAASRVIGAHFMNPVPVQKGVEIIRGLQTSDEVLARTNEFIARMGKIVSNSEDSPGFLANRVLMPYINEAIITVETGVGKKEDVDSIMKNGCAMPMGPLQLADFIGLDTCLAIMEVLYRDTGDSKYRPSVLLKKYVDAGWLGVKTGRGFYNYEQAGAKL